MLNSFYALGNVWLTSIGQNYKNREGNGNGSWRGIPVKGVNDLVRYSESLETLTQFETGSVVDEVNLRKGKFVQRFQSFFL